jgi:hypothetical protein
MKLRILSYAMLLATYYSWGFKLVIQGASVNIFWPDLPTSKVTFLRYPLQS